MEWASVRTPTHCCFEEETGFACNVMNSRGILCLAWCCPLSTAAEIPAFSINLDSLKAVHAGEMLLLL